jgi:hypothetical protein
MSDSTVTTKSLVGIFSQGITWPAEYVKNIKQFKGTNTSLPNVLRSRILQYGLLGETRHMCRSMVPTMVAVVPRFVTRFTVYEELNKYNKDNNQAYKFGAGLAAGAVEAAFIMTPSEVIKVRAVKENIGVSRIISNIYKENGISGFWKGGLATITRQSTTQGVSLYSNDIFNPLFKPYMGSYSGLASGMISGIIAVGINNPIDVVKTHQQETNKTVNIANEVKEIYQKNGIKGFYRGGLLRALRVAPLHGFTYFFYDLLSNWK